MSSGVKKRVHDFQGFLSKVLLTVALQLHFFCCYAALSFALSVLVLLVSLPRVPHCSFPFVLCILAC